MGILPGIPLLLIHRHMLRNGNLLPGSTLLRLHLTAAPALDHKNTLTQRLLIFIKIHQIIDRSPECRLMLLGQLSAKSHPAVAKRLSELTKSPYKPVRCLIQNNSPGFTGKLLQDRFSFFLIRRKKSLESKTPGMQA